MNDEPEILFEQRGSLAIITMNRPRALNALTLNMIREMQPRLESWAREDSVSAVLIHGAGEKAFCAGGDVKAVWAAGKEGGDLTKDFFREEYILNRTIFRFPKPYIALIDGVTMGGGVGLSVLGSHRVAGPKTMMAMPETAIGLFPDVGGSYFLPRFPGKTGLYLALTGERAKAADCCYLGFASHYSESGEAAIIEALVSANLPLEGAKEAVDEVLSGLSSDAGPAPIAEVREIIDRSFAGARVEEIISALEAEGGDWSKQQLETLGKRSPTSVKVAFEQLKRGEGLDFESCMTMEYRMSQACMAGHDFYEGIRAVLVDKDHAPKWSPDSLGAVSDELVARHFADLGARELTFA